MSSSYSSSLRIELIGDGDQAGTWGSTTDGNLGNLIDTAIGGAVTVSVSGSAQALTAIQGSTTSSSTLNQSVYATIKLTGGSTNFTIYTPNSAKTYIVWNATSYTATFENATGLNSTTSAGGTTTTVAANEKTIVWSDGTNYYKIVPNVSAVTGTLPIASGGTGQVTANAAFNALVPSQGSANGKYLKSNGTDTAWDQIDISTGDITGTLPVANGGTGQTTQQAAINALAGTQTANRVLRSDGTNTTLSQVALATDVSGTLAVANGGTGQTSYTNGQLLIGNTTGSTLTKATLTAGTGISVTNGAGSISIASTITGGFSNMVVLTSTNASYSIPATKIKVTVIGGGGGGESGTGCSSGGGGGGAGGAAVQIFSGLTVGNTLNITVGAGGRGGNYQADIEPLGGSTSSVASGTQAISTASATGGAAGSRSTFAAGGIGSGGLLNLPGGCGSYPLGSGAGGEGGDSILGAGGTGGTQITLNGGAGRGYGGGGGGSVSYNGYSGGAGSAGVVIIEY